MKAKNTLKIFASFLAAAALAVGANAEFAKTNTYTEGQFKDVKANAWYAKEVASAYELGFMNGTDDEVFSPDGNVTVAQGITMAARVNAAYNKKEIPAVSGGNWYDMYVKYAVDNGVMKDGQFDNLARNITRAEMATLFADAIPASEYNAINKVEHIPDVIESNDYAKKILMLYNAGIVMGSDDYGTFNPDSDIKRSESAAIINRVALKENRVKGTLKEYTARDAYSFIYFDGVMSNSLTSHAGSVRENIEAGWRIDNRGGSPRTNIEDTYTSASSISTTQPVTLMREFNKIDKDKVIAEFVVTPVIENGGSVKFADIDVKDAFVYEIKDGKWQVLGKDGKYTAIADCVMGRPYNFRVYMDIPAGTVKTYIDNKDCGEAALLSDNIASIRYHISTEATGSIVPGRMNFVANYGVFENFDIYRLQEAYGWKTEGNVSADSGELVFKGKASAAKPFDAIDVKYIAELLAIFPEGEQGGFKVLSGTTTAVEFVSKNGKLYANGTEVYEKLTKNMWYRLRVEANPSTGKADIVINGRTLATVALGATEPVTSLVMFSENGNIRMDDIKVYANADHYDYAPAPVAKANLDDYILAMNVCSLWYNNGTHYGWACITPYDENKPVLGYYDEGSRESADWEIKYMVEGGIDIQVLCWYSNVSTGPLKTPSLSYQLHEGLQHAKYQDYMKYALIWEAGSATKFNAKQFREHVIPYWFENYFLDENYAVIDNKLLLHVYSLNQIAGPQYFGNVAAAKAEFEYLTEVAKSYGFDGFIFVSNGETSMIESVGLDAFAAYHWGATGYQYNVNVDKNNAQADKAKTSYAIPTISVGYSDFAWRNAKQPLMTKDDWAASFEWAKNTYIPKHAKKGTWQEKMIWVSTWNEYGEGTYIMPSEGLRGFDYLDVLRDKFTDMPKELPHIIPNEEQLERINHFYPQYRRLLRFQGYYEDPFDIGNRAVEYEAVKTVALTKETVKDGGNFQTVGFENGMLIGKSTGDDFNFAVEGAKGLDLSEVVGVRFDLEVPRGKTLQVFFATEEDPSLSETKSAQIKITGDGLNKVTIDFTTRNALWKGTLKHLRIDPCNGAGVDFKVGNVEFIKKKEIVVDSKYLKDNKLFVNTKEVDSIIYPENHNGKVLYPFDPETAVDFLLFTFLDWNHDERILTLTGNNHTVSFKDGSDKFTVDGTEKPLGYTLYSVDGIPMIDFKVLADAFGFTYKEDGTNVYIETPEIALFGDGGFVKEGAWEFNGYDTDGWRSSNITFTANGEYLRIDNTIGTNKDPNMSASNRVIVPAKKYKSIELKVRYKYDREKPDMLTFYFITNIDKQWNENKTLRAQLKSTDSNGEWETYTIDLTAKEEWLGELAGFRFDPFNAIGVMDVDYIRLIEDPDYDAEKWDMSGIINGDAEIPGLITFTSPTAKVTIEEDAAKEGNHVYRFTGPDYKAWSYAVHKYPFETGKKYSISFDARGVSDSKGNKVRMNLAVNIQYPSTEGKDHGAGGKWLEADGSWVHFDIEYIPGPMTAKDNASFSCYITPTAEDVSDIFELDNIVIKEIK